MERETGFEPATLALARRLNTHATEHAGVGYTVMFPALARALYASQCDEVGLPWIAIRG